MKFSVCCRNELKVEEGFTLLEILIVITISSLLAAIFMQLIISLYQSNNFLNLQNSWQLDGYLVVDFMSLQIKNASKVEIINQKEIDVFSYYGEEYQWLKFNIYQSGGHNALGRAIGSNNPDFKDFGRNLALVDQIEDLNFKLVDPDLLKITLWVKKGEEKLIISRLIDL
jgi:prepilin-type N-terminal cleavage/methylation domain-containing protein